MGKEMPAGLGFIVQAILGMMGSQSLLHVGALSETWLGDGIEHSHKQTYKISSSSAKVCFAFKAYQ